MDSPSDVRGSIRVLGAAVEQEQLAAVQIPARYEGSTIDTLRFLLDFRVMAPKREDRPNND